MVLAAAAAAGRYVAVNHQYREKPIFSAVKERIGAPDVGRLVFCQLWQLMDLPPWDEKTPWRAAMPNRTLFEGGVHLVDLLLHLYGTLPEAVYARHSSGLDPAHDADAIHLVTLEFPGSRLGQITIDRLCRAATRYLELPRRLRAGVASRIARRPRLRAGRDEARWAPRSSASSGAAGAPLGRSVAFAARRSPATRVTQPSQRRARSSERSRPRSRKGSSRRRVAPRARDGLRVIGPAYRSAATGERVVARVRRRMPTTADERRTGHGRARARGSRRSLVSHDRASWWSRYSRSVGRTKLAAPRAPSRKSCRSALPRRRELGRLLGVRDGAAGCRRGRRSRHL